MIRDDGPPPLEGLTVLIVDDHRVFAEVIATHLANAVPGLVVHLATRLSEARALARATRPDVAIVDYNLAGECGLDLISDLTALALATDVIVVSGGRDADQIMAAFARGAQAWVDKTGRVEELLDAAVAVRAGDMYLSSASVRPVICRELEVTRSSAAAAGFAAACTERELEVLRQLMAGMSRPAVADVLGLSTNTVRTHVQSLLRTFGVHSALALIAAARESGITPAEVVERPLVRLT